MRVVPGRGGETARARITLGLAAATAALLVMVALGTRHERRDAIAEAGSIIVDPDGRGGDCDDHRGRWAVGVATPLCTIERAVSLARARDRIALRAGAYPALELRAVRPRAEVTIAAARHVDGEPEAVRVPTIRLLDGSSHLRFSHLQLTGSATAPSFQVMDGGSRDVVLERSTVRSTRQDAIELRWGTRRVTIEDNLIHTNGQGSGVVFAETSDLPGSPYREARPPISDVVIRGNHFHGIAIDAIRPANFDGLLVEGNEIDGIVENGAHCDAFQSVFGGRRLVFRGNYIHDNAGQGLFIKDGRVTGAVVENNVFANNRLEIQVQIFDTVGLRFVNNTVWRNEHNMMLRGDVRDAVIRNNLIQDLEVEDPVAARRELRQDHNVIASGWSWGPQRGDVRATPRFIAPERGDFRLAAASAGIDAGTAEGAPARDKACRGRVGVPDGGALERRPDSSAGDTARAGACHG